MQIFRLGDSRSTSLNAVPGLPATRGLDRGVGRGETGTPADSASVTCQPDVRELTRESSVGMIGAEGGH
jgi:hypothetical protein